MPKFGQRSPGCTIPIQMIEEHFEKRMVGDNTVFSPDPDLLKDFAPQDGAQLEEPISSNAVWYRLLKMGNTAPGPDGISYQELKRVDPKATILTQIFQIKDADKQNWIYGTTLRIVSHDLDLSPNTLTDWYSFSREVMVRDNTPIGSPRKIVEINKCIFGKRKDNRGRWVHGKWVLGGV
ncbi:hypothetical protein LAZ67_1008345 [Cordylochernes scorpioides]|uniref:Uncharacterized protein n=1 Tax=Cordylochernes scorpioides TaxID=51811 RepID=A0ABY6K2Z2_9ARAC|nr:hypothetical protein LAZ67_1008345 [Cordylochernes scorpioides]